MNYSIKCAIVAIGVLVGTQDLVTADNASSKKVFVFDFHGTIADTNMPRAVAVGIAYLPVSTFYVLYQLLWKRSLMRHMWEHGLSKKYPLMVMLKDACGHAAACQTLRPQVVDAIEGLYKQGYCLYMFSGITPRAHAILKERYPAFFSLFDKIIGAGLDGGPSKHDQAFYGLADSLISQDSGTVKPDVIFFDNEIDNCNRGSAQGWQTVHVTSPDQCADSIKDLGKK